MGTFTPDNIRNIVIAGHSDSGKSTFLESSALALGIIQKMGTIEEGNTIADYHDDEKEKKFSINAALINGEWKNTKLNLIDTPGFLDFVGDVQSGIRVADTVMITVNSINSIEVGTENVWSYAADYYKPVLFAITKLDRENSDFENVLGQLKDYYGHEVVPIQFPINEGVGHNTIVDCILMKALTFEPGKKGNITITDIPERFIEKAEDYHTNLVETVAETDEELMNRFFETGTLTEDELREGIRHGMVSRTFFPVYCVTPGQHIGTERMLDVFVNLTPSPIERGPAHAQHRETKEEVLVETEQNGKTAAFIFKTSSEPHLGEMSIFRIYSGKIKSGMDLFNAETKQEERLGQIYVLNGNKRHEVPELVAGDIGAVVKLKDTHTNDTLAEKGVDYVIRPVKFPNPVIRTAIKPLTKNDEAKISTGLYHLHEEDPSFFIENDHELAQTILSGQGEIHLDVIIRRLKEKFGVTVEQERPKIPYRETIKGSIRIQGKYKKQSGGRGQYGDVWLRIEPLPRGKGFEFVDEVVGGVVPGKFIPSVEKGIVEAMEKGILSGHKVVDIKVTIDDGSYHPVDSSDMAFKMAGSLGFKKGFTDAKPVILEPIYKITVKAPEEYMGEVMGDISSRRGKIQGMDSEGHFQIINATVPLAELYKYQSVLRSLTQGRGTHFRQFDHYEEVPFEVTQKIVEEYQKRREEEAS